MYVYVCMSHAQAYILHPKVEIILCFAKLAVTIELECRFI